MFSQAPAIGIDLGTCYSCCAVYMNDRVEIIPNDEGNRRTPSYVAFTEMNRLIGNSAEYQAARNPLNTIYDAKRLIGRKYTEPTVQNDIKLWPFKVEAGLDDKPMIAVNYKGETKKFHPEEISAMVLTKMKASAEAYLGKPVTKAVITVPTYFNDSQRQATKDAGVIAGLNVLRIISEPTAAAMAYGFGKYYQQVEHVLVFDLGGGTMNVSLLALEFELYEVKAVAGNTHLGGEDFDNKLVEYCCDEFLKKNGIDIRGRARALTKLKIYCERAKKDLSSANQTTIEIDSLSQDVDFVITITRAKFEELCMSMFKECIPPIEKVLKDSGITKNQIHEIVLVGGSTRIPKVQELLRDYFNGKELNKSINPEEAVAYGAAVQAAVLTGQSNEQIRDVLLLDVTPFSLGIETGDGVRTVLIPRNTTIPTKKSQTFSTSSENQTSITFQIYEGEGQITENCHKLGQINLDGIAPAPKGVPEIEVYFDLDENGIMIVNAEDKTSKISSKITIANERGRLSKDEIEKAVVEENKRKAEELFVNQKAQVKQNLSQMIQTAQIQLKELQYLLQQEENWMDSHPNAKIEQYEQKFKSLEEIIDPIFTSFRLKSQRN